MVSVRENKKKIVIIADEDRLHEIFSYNFQLDKFDVSIASDLSEAVRLTKSIAPDVITLDKMMLQMNGPEAIREIRQISDNPVIVLME